MRGQLKYVAKARETDPWAFGALAGLAVLLLAALALGTGCYLPSQRFPVDQASTAVKVDAFCLTSNPWGTHAVHLNMGFGSGAVLDSGHVVTAAHVPHCEYLTDLVVEMADGRMVRSRVAAESAEFDVAVLEPVGGDQYSEVDRPVLARVEMGMRVCAVHSSPSRGETCGFVDKIEGRGMDSTVHFKGDSGDDIEHGNSGAPVYDDQGHLVCLVTRLSSMGGGWCTSLFEHKRLLKL